VEFGTHYYPVKPEKVRMISTMPDQKFIALVEKLQSIDKQHRDVKKEIESLKEQMAAFKKTGSKKKGFFESLLSDDDDDDNKEGDEN
jgi:hypothetical protein